MTSCYNSPIGWLELSASETALQSIRFLKEEPADPKSENALTKQATTELSEYFKGNRKRFTIPLNPEGTSFQEKVWGLLQEIPYGQTITYGAIAEKLGDPNKVRAVGTANGKNPIPIIIPCHRVIGANQNLIGYAGGVGRKKYLLKHEDAILL